MSYLILWEVSKLTQNGNPTIAFIEVVHVALQLEFAAVWIITLDVP